jgi:hypothetical protein
MQTAYKLKLMFKNFWKKKRGPVPLYEYPNDVESNLDEALNAIWKVYKQNDNFIQIGIQGEGGRGEQFASLEAVLKGGTLHWKDFPEEDWLTVLSAEEFVEKFALWASKRIVPYVDSGDYSLGVDFSEKYAQNVPEADA